MIDFIDIIKIWTKKSDKMEQSNLNEGTWPKIATKEEYKKCVCDSSRVYMIENFLLPLVLNSYNCHLTEAQKDILYKTSVTKKTVVTKGRCCGLSTLILCKVAADIILSGKDETEIFYISWNSRTQDLFRDRLSNLIKRVPKILWTVEHRRDVASIRYNSLAGEMSFENGSNLYFISPQLNEKWDMKLKNNNSNVKRCVYIDEMFYLGYDSNPKRDEPLWEKCYQVIAPKRIDYWIMGSSPNNQDNKAFDFLKDMDYKGLRIHMFPIPSLQIKERVKDRTLTENEMDEILGRIKKTETLRNDENKWLKDIDNTIF